MGGLRKLLPIFMLEYLEKVGLKINWALRLCIPLDFGSLH